MTTGPAIKANEEEVSYAVALIALFGMTAMFTYPLLAHWMFGGDAEQIGFFLGAAIHDTSQVAGSGLVYQLHFEAPQALDVAVTTKLVRNACMGAVLPLIAILYHRQSSSEASATHRAHWLKWSQWIPPFVVLFLGLAAIRSIGDLGDDPFGVLNRGTWVELISISKIVSIVCLTTAMAAVGLGTSFSQLRMLGWKPLCIGCSAAVLVGGVSCLLVTILGHWQ
jgi:uncharacterized integral membrane protein (TIGR00698 family)